eukprot:RCo001907
MPCVVISAAIPSERFVFLVRGPKGTSNLSLLFLSFPFSGVEIPFWFGVMLFLSLHFPFSFGEIEAVAKPLSLPPSSFHRTRLQLFSAPLLLRGREGSLV